MSLAAIVVRRHPLTFDAIAVAVSLLSYWYTLQRYGIYDYFDGMRYLASGVSLLTDHSAAPIPIAYIPGVTAADFAGQETLSYPSILFQIWIALTTAIGSWPLLMTSVFAVSFFIIHNIAFVRIARLYLPDTLAVAALLALCFVPSVFHRTMTRPLPDGILSTAYTLSIFLALTGRPKIAGLVDALGSVIRFQGLLFSWTSLLFAERRRAIFEGALAYVFGTAVTLLAISLLANAFGPNAPSNFGFYLSFFSIAKFGTMLSTLPAQLIHTTSALLVVPEFLFLLFSLPLISFAAFFSGATAERRFLVNAGLSALYISYISFFAMTISAGGGYDGRYLMYFIPPLFIADFVAFDFLFRRFVYFKQFVRAGLLFIAIGFTLIYLYHFLRNDMFWDREYLPDQRLSLIPSDAIVALATADEAASEIYSVSKARKQMWLPADPATFLLRNNGTIDFIVIGGYWNNDLFPLWRSILELGMFSDSGGNQFSLAAKTTFYTVFSRDPPSAKLPQLGFGAGCARLSKQASQS